MTTNIDPNTITPETYLSDDKQRRIADDVMHRANLTPHDVAEMTRHGNGWNCTVLEFDDDGKIQVRDNEIVSRLVWVGDAR